MPVKRSVLVHSCNVKKDGKFRDILVTGDLYVGELGVSLEQQKMYYALPKSCRCKRRVTSWEATSFVAQGWAVWILQFKKRKGEVVLNDEVSTKIWMPVVRERVPRVDLISRADIERAFIGSEKKTKHTKFNHITQRFETVKEPPEGFTAKQWATDEAEEVNFERRIRRQYRKYIEECHKVAMDARAELIVPFRPDPFEGRTIFGFGSNQQT